MSYGFIDLQAVMIQHLAQRLEAHITLNMFGAKTKSMASLVSQQWGTGELVEGMEFLLTDLRNELPDEAAHLEDCSIRSLVVLGWLWDRKVSMTKDPDHYLI